MVTIRRAGPEDVAALRRIAAGAYAPYVARTGRAPAPMTADYAKAVRDRQAWAEIRLYTNEAMTENLSYYPRHGYTETHRGEQDGFRRVFFRKQVTTR